MNTKQIRQTILDLAIRGELVPQDPTDEPASVLLERIRAEKEQLIKDKKLKRDKTANEPIDEVPFELPEGWEWCRLENFGKLTLHTSLICGTIFVVFARYLNQHFWENCP